MTSSGIDYKYNYTYCAIVVDQFLDKYSRVTCFVAKKIGMDPRSFRQALIRLLRIGDSRWRLMRDTLKQIEIQGMYDELSEYDRANFIFYLKSVKSIEVDKWLDE